MEVMMTIVFHSFVLFIATVFMVSACGEDPIEYSAPVMLNLKAKSDDVVQGAINSEKSINAEAGDPYGTFIKDAREKLGKTDPSRVELKELTCLLGTASKGVTALDQVFAGRVDVLFELDASKNSYPVSHTTDPTGSGPVKMDLDFHFADLAEQDRKPFFDGNFKVHIRGQAAADFETKGAEADLQLTLSFEAYE
jgi:hypothetical protein